LDVNASLRLSCTLGIADKLLKFIIKVWDLFWNSKAVLGGMAAGCYPYRHKRRRVYGGQDRLHDMPKAPQKTPGHEAIISITLTSKSSFARRLKFANKQ
jgi:hypothetical protein